MAALVAVSMDYLSAVSKIWSVVYIFGVVCPPQEVDTRQVVRSEIEKTGKEAGEEEN